MKIWKSWNRKVSHTYSNYFKPSTQDELAEIIKNCDKTVRVIGNSYSSADICGGTDTIISLENYNRVLDIDKEKRQITVESGITLKDMMISLEKEGLTIDALPDIDSITIGGAVSTGTHGTGKNALTLSDYIEKLTIIDANGEIKEITKDNPNFGAYSLSLGVLGVISTITFNCVDLYDLYITEKPVRDGVWIENYIEYLKKYDFVRLLWLPHTGYGYLITANREKSEDFVIVNQPKIVKYRRKVSAFLYKYTSKFPRFTVVANKIIYLLFFSHYFTHKGTLYQETVTKKRGNPLVLGEWIVPLSKFQNMMYELKRELNSTKNSGYAHIPMDVRFIKKSDSWLGYSFDEDSVTIGIVTRNVETSDSYEAFNVVANVMLKHGGRPHWAKIHNLKRDELKEIYPKFEDFINLRKELDPNGKFLNKYLSEIF